MIQEICTSNGVSVKQWHEIKGDRYEIRLMILGYWLDRGWISGAEWYKRSCREIAERQRAMLDYYEGPNESREPPRWASLKDGRLVKVTE